MQTNNASLRISHKEADNRSTKNMEPASSQITKPKQNITKHFFCGRHSTGWKIKKLKTPAKGAPKALSQDSRLGRERGRPSSRKNDPVSRSCSCNGVYCTISASRTKIMKTAPSNNDQPRVKNRTKAKKFEIGRAYSWRIYREKLFMTCPPT